LILSSSEAKRDLKELNPLCGDKAKVLHFVANTQVPQPEAIAQAIGQYGVRRPYFYLPNHFWQHKNHCLVIEALRILKDRDIFASVVASGNSMDPRRPRHFDELMMYVKQAKVEDRFLPIGVITYAEVLALMAGSLAVINPSLFEGWSTTVEEAKSMGKVVLLSDIPVHREQAPLRGRYFQPDRAEDLAILMAEALAGYDQVVDQENMLAAQEAVPARLERFAQEYEEIVMEQIV
jgi:glycosyltransferase involved in cell wall biosynthesis